MELNNSARRDNSSGVRGHWDIGSQVIYGAIAHDVKGENLPIIVETFQTLTLQVLLDLLIQASKTFVIKRDFGRAKVPATTLQPLFSP